MAPKVQLPLPPMELKAVALAAVLVDKDVVLHTVLREAIDESDWKHEAIASAVGVDGQRPRRSWRRRGPCEHRHGTRDCSGAEPCSAIRILADRRPRF
jgi:hypothetical protein